MITLGIIGVVAAMTLPTLIQNHQKQTYVTGLKKAYSVLQNAFAQMALDEDVTDWWQTYCGGTNPKNEEECYNRVKKQFNVVKSEYFEGPIRLNNWNFNGYDLYQIEYVYTNDGMSYIFDCYGRYIDVDINGDKGPNKWGRDRFVFEVNYGKNKIEPSGISSYYDYQTYCTPEKLKQKETNGQSCTAKVLIEGKMDY